MKILLTVDPELPVPPILYGGIERIVHFLIEQYVQKGYDVFLCANPESKVPCNLIGWQGVKSQNKIDSIKNTALLTKLVLKEKFDVIHSFSRLGYMSALLPLRIPKIMSYQREPSLRGIKIAYQLSKKNSLFFTGCSEYIAAQIRPFAPSFCIHNGCPAHLYTPNFTLSEESPLVFLGRIEKIKGTHTAIKVAQQTGKKLIIAGNIPSDDASQRYFKQEIEPYIDNKQIIYVGPVNDVQKNDLLRNAYCFLMPIEWNEPFGIVMAEALACGTPILGFNRGSVPEIVNNGVNGYICSSVEDMIAKVSNIATLKRENNRLSYEKCFSDTAIANQYEDLYRQILNQ